MYHTKSCELNVAIGRCFPYVSHVMSVCRPVVKAADDASNFDDYSALKPMQEMHELSASEQLRFADF